MLGVIASYIVGALIVAGVSYAILAKTKREINEQMDGADTISSIILGLIWPGAFIYIVWQSLKKDSKKSGGN